MTSTQIPNLPTHAPARYDDALADGWTYHRNGVAGCGFFAKVTAGPLAAYLLIAWGEFSEDGEEESYPVTAVPLAVLVGVARLDAVGPSFDREVRRSPATLRHVIATNDASPELRAYDMVGADEDDINGRVLVVSDIRERNDYRVASFLLSEVLAGDASTTLRGDTLYDEAVAVERLAIGLDR